MVKMSTVWDRTAEFLSDNIATLLPLALFAFFIPASIEGNFAAAGDGRAPGPVLGLRLIQIAFALLSLWGTLAITAMALDIAGEERPGAIALRRLPAAVLVSIVMLFCAGLLCLPVIGILVANGYDLTAMTNGQNAGITPTIAATLAISVLVLFFIFLWLGARLMLTSAVIVRERRVVSAISQSWALTRGATLRIVGVIILYLIVSWVAQLAANMVFGSVFALVAGGDGDGEGITLAGVLTSVVVAAVRTIFLVIPPAFTAKLYLTLAARAGLRGTATAA